MHYYKLINIVESVYRMAADADLFVSLDTKDLERVDLIELVEEDLRATPSPHSSPQISCRLNI